ncbi:MAG: hypothetical protein ACM35G_01715, partial [Planctomycetaceae bacterium]
SIRPANSFSWARIAPEKPFPILCNLPLIAHQLASARSFFGDRAMKTRLVLGTMVAAGVISALGGCNSREPSTPPARTIRDDGSLLGDTGLFGLREPADVRLRRIELELDDISGKVDGISGKVDDIKRHAYGPRFQ